MTYKSDRSNVLVYRLRYCLYVSAFCLFMAMPSSIYANAIIAMHDWDATPVADAGNWDTLGSSATVAENTGTPGDHYLEISFPGGIDAGPGSQWYETISTPSDDLFAGTWITDYWIEFDFWADDVVPDQLQVRWGVDGGRTWGNSLNTAGVGVDTWGSLRTDTFSDFTDWKLEPYATQGEFLADLDAIDWIGVYIFRDGTDAEVYGVDDFKLMVPEPAEYMLLFAALGTALIAMRRRKGVLAVIEA